MRATKSFLTRCVFSAFIEFIERQNLEKTRCRNKQDVENLIGRATMYKYHRRSFPSIHYLGNSMDFCQLLESRWLFYKKVKIYKKKVPKSLQMTKYGKVNAIKLF